MIWLAPLLSLAVAATSSQMLECKSGNFRLNVDALGMAELKIDESTCPYSARHMSTQPQTGLEHASLALVKSESCKPTEPSGLNMEVEVVLQNPKSPSGGAMIFVFRDKEPFRIRACTLRVPVFENLRRRLSSSQSF